MTLLRRREVGEMLSAGSGLFAQGYVDRWCRVGAKVRGFPAAILLEYTLVPAGKAFTLEQVERFKARLAGAKAMVRDGDAAGLAPGEALAELERRLETRAVVVAGVHRAETVRGRTEKRAKQADGVRRYPPLRRAAAGGGVHSAA